MNETKHTYAVYHAKTGKFVANKVRHEGLDGKKSRSPYFEPLLNGVPTNALELFGVREINGVSTVVIVEGEHLVGDLAKEGITAVSSFSHRPIAEAIAPLLDVETVTVWPDNDTPGADKADAIIEALQKAGHPRIKRVVWVDAPPKGDARDAIKKGIDVKKLIGDAIQIDPPAATHASPTQAELVVRTAELAGELWHDPDGKGYATVAVSYTHLTLPTIYSV